MKNTFSILFVLFFVLTSCQKQRNYEIGFKKVGELNASQTPDTFFEKKIADSVFYEENNKLVKTSKLVDNIDQYIGYIDGVKALSMGTKLENDSLLIQYVEILSNQFKTPNGIGLDSDFQSINALESIDEIQTSFATVLLSLNKYNASIKLDKSEMGITGFNLTPVSKGQIPDSMKPKSLVVWFN